MSNYFNLKGMSPDDSLRLLNVHMVEVISELKEIRSELGQQKILATMKKFQAEPDEIIPKKESGIRTVRQITQLYPSFKESSLRWLIFNANENGFNKVITRIGRRVLIDLDSFENWINSHKQEESK